MSLTADGKGAVFDVPNEKAQAFIASAGGWPVKVDTTHVRQERCKVVLITESLLKLYSKFDRKFHLSSALIYFGSASTARSAMVVCLCGTWGTCWDTGDMGGMGLYLR
jgi:hypothetical protein